LKSRSGVVKLPPPDSDWAQATMSRKSLGTLTSAAAISAVVPKSKNTFGDWQVVAPLAVPTAAVRVADLLP